MKIKKKTDKTSKGDKNAKPEKNGKNDRKKAVESSPSSRSGSSRRRDSSRKEDAVIDYKLPSGRARNRGETSREPEPKKPPKKANLPLAEEEKLTYESLGINPPELFEYETCTDVTIV